MTASMQQQLNLPGQARLAGGSSAAAVRLPAGPKPQGSDQASTGPVAPRGKSPLAGPKPHGGLLSNCPLRKRERGDGAGCSPADEVGLPASIKLLQLLASGSSAQYATYHCERYWLEAASSGASLAPLQVAGAAADASQGPDEVTKEHVAVLVLSAVAAAAVDPQALLGWMRADHPCVVRMLGLGVTAHRRLYVVRELATAGSLRHYLDWRRSKGRSGGLPEAEALWFFRQLVYGLSYCVASGLKLRGVRPEQLLLFRSKTSSTQPPYLKINLEGLGALGNTTQQLHATQAYTAPELLGAGAEAADTAEAADKAAVFSAGLVLHELLTGELPRTGPGEHAAAAQPSPGQPGAPGSAGGADAVPVRTWGPQLQALLDSMLAADPQRRMRLADVRRSAWFAAGLGEGAAEVAIRGAPCTRAHGAERKERRVRAVLEALRQQSVVGLLATELQRTLADVRQRLDDLLVSERQQGGCSERGGACPGLVGN